MSFTQSYDYIVVGGGSSGCIVAKRLAEQADVTVLLLEAGQLAEENPISMVADGFSQAFATDALMWDRMSTPQSHCSKRSLYMGSGTGMGGSGSVNGMVYTRGDKRDFDQWPQGWKWADIESSFAAVEDTLKVKPRAAATFTDTCINAAKAVGFSHKDKLIDGELKGYLGYQTMNYDGSERRSSYVSFLRNNKPDNLTLRTGAQVTQLVFNEEKTVIGVMYRVGQQEIYSQVRHEVILCAGALETPKLLMLSGVGPQDQLQPNGIEPVAFSEQIGRNLHDHPNVCIFYHGKQPSDSRYPQLYGFDRMNHDTPLSPEQADTCFVFYSAAASLRHSMHRMLPAVVLPAALFHHKGLRKFLRGCVDVVFKLPIIKDQLARLYGVVVILGKPESRGRLTLNADNVQGQANIDPCYYADSRDMDTLVAGVEKAHQLAQQAPLQQWGNRCLVSAVTAKKRSKLEKRTKLEKWIKGATMTTFHYCGTCAMGESDNAPVDTRLRVRGVKGVRVADASVMPVTPVSALNAPSMMIGYRAVEFIRDDRPKAKRKVSAKATSNKVASNKTATKNRSVKRRTNKSNKETSV